MPKKPPYLCQVRIDLEDRTTALYRHGDVPKLDEIFTLGGTSYKVTKRDMPSQADWRRYQLNAPKIWADPLREDR